MNDGLKVAVTGPTGDIGLATLRALDASPAVAEVVGMARRPFDPTEHGLSKVSYRQGDVLDRGAVDAAVAGADVVIHLAFIIFGDPDEAQPVNVEGSRNVFEAAVAAGVKRLVYTSSVAAYGFHTDNPQPLTEETAPRGTEGFYYSAHKAELEELLEQVLAGRETDAYVFRPSIVGGPDAHTLVETVVGLLPVYGQLPLVRQFFGEVPFLAPVLPDPGVPIQLVHHDDVAQALLAATEGRGEPGHYNLAGPGTVTVSDIAHGLGWLSVPLPAQLVGPLDEVLRRVPGVPAEFAWLAVLRVAVLMDCARAREQLGWEPHYDAADTLAGTIRGAREDDVIR
jgi:nucleoside-diphosphate-sugar epimerase